MSQSSFNRLEHHDHSYWSIDRHRIINKLRNSVGNLFLRLVKLLLVALKIEKFHTFTGSRPWKVTVAS